MPEPKTSFAQFLQQARIAAKLTVPELAKRSGVSASYISRIENEWRAAPSLKVLERFAIALGVPLEQMLRAAGYLPGGVRIDEHDALSGVLLRTTKDLTPKQVTEILEYIEFRKRQWSREEREGDRVDDRSGEADHPR